MRDQVTVLGLGNPLMGDDGAGLTALEVLRGSYWFGPEVGLEDGATFGLSLLPLVEEADKLLMLDAVRFGGRPGSIVVRDGRELPQCLFLKLSPHQAGLVEVLALAGMRGHLPTEFALVGVEVASANFGASLSREVQRALPEMVAAAVAKLESWGCDLHPLAPLETGVPNSASNMNFQLKRASHHLERNNDNLRSQTTHK